MKNGHQHQESASDHGLGGGVDRGTSRRRLIMAGMGMLLSAARGAGIAGPCRAADIRPQTLVEGNLYIPRALREKWIALGDTDSVLRDDILRQLFRLADAPLKLVGEFPKDYVRTVGNRVLFGRCLSVLMGTTRNCRVENGVYVVYPLETTNIIPGRPDLDKRLFKRKVVIGPPTDAEIAAAAKAAPLPPGYHRMLGDYPLIRPFLEDLFREAGLSYQVRDDVGKYFAGLNINCDFRAAISFTIRAAMPPLTFDIRDGVYYFYPPPTG